MTTTRRKIDRARPALTTTAIWNHTTRCCDFRTPGQTCWGCGKGPNDQPISVNRALASNA